MARPWRLVTRDPVYQSLTPEEQQETATEYFETVVATQLPETATPEERDQLRVEFFDHTARVKEENSLTDGIITTASQQYNVPEDEIKAIIFTESAFDPQAESPAGAQGLMQMMPQTAKAMGVKNSFDIVDNVSGGVKYYRHLLDMYNGNRTLARAAYNWGPTNLNKYGLSNMPEETANYLSKISSILGEDKQSTIQSSGNYFEPMQFEPVQIEPIELPTLEPTGPRPWAEVAQDPEYQNLSSTQKAETMKEYFDTVVAPQLDPNAPAELLEDTRRQFFQLAVGMDTQDDSLIDAAFDEHAATPMYSKGRTVGEVREDPLDLVGTIRKENPYMDDEELVREIVARSADERLAIEINKATPEELDQIVAEAKQYDQPEFPADERADQELYNSVSSFVRSVPNFEDRDFEERLFMTSIAFPDISYEQDELNRIANKQDFDRTVQSFVNYGAGSMAAFSRGIYMFSDQLDRWSQWVADTSGYWEKGGAFEQAAKDWKNAEEFWKSFVKDPTFIEEVGAEVVGGVLPGMMEFILGPHYAALKGAEQEGIKGALKESAKWFFLKSALKSTHSLKLLPRSTAMGSVGAAEAYVSGERDPRELAKSAAVMAAMGLTGGKGTESTRDYIRNVIKSAKTDAAYTLGTPGYLVDKIPWSKAARSRRAEINERTQKQQIEDFDPAFKKLHAAIDEAPILSAKEDILQRGNLILAKLPTKLLDRIHPLKTISETAYKYAAVYPGRMDAVVTLLDNLVRRLSPIHGNHKLFSDYLLAQRMRVRAQQGFKNPNGITEQEASRQAGKAVDFWLNKVVRPYEELSKQSARTNPEYYDQLESLIEVVERAPYIDEVGRIPLFDQGFIEEITSRRRGGRKAGQPIEQSIIDTIKIQEWNMAEEDFRNFFDKHILQEGVESGVLNAQVVDQIRRDNPYYATFEVAEKLSANIDDLPSRPSKEYFSVGSQKVIQRTKGTEKKINDPIEATVRKMIDAQMLYERNRVIRAMIEDPNRLVHLQQVFEAPADSKGRVKEAAKLKAKGLEYGTDYIFSNDFDRRTHDTISYMKNGSKQTYVVEKLIAESLKQMTTKSAPEWINLVNGVFRRAATTANPAFLVPNAIRDGFLTWVASPVHKWYQPHIFLSDWLKGIKAGGRHVFEDYRKVSPYKVIDKSDPEYLWRVHTLTGGGHGWTASEIRGPKGGLRGQIFRTKSGEKGIAYNAFKWGGLKFIEDLNEMVEYGPRLAIRHRIHENLGKEIQSRVFERYKDRISNIKREQMKARGDYDRADVLATELRLLSKQMQHEINVEKSFLGRQSAIDFNRGGTFIKAVNQYVPFLNARVQGLNTLVRALLVESEYGNRGQAWAKLGMVIAMPTIAAFVANMISDSDGRARKDTPDYLLRNNWVINLGWKRGKEGKLEPNLLLIPKGETGQFANVLERFLYEQYNKDQRFGTFLLQLFSDVSPIPFANAEGLDLTQSLSTVLPPAVKAIIEPVAGYDFYRDRDIESAAMMRKPIYARYKDDTPEFFKQLSKAFYDAGVRYDSLSPLRLQQIGRDVAPNWGEAAGDPRQVLLKTVERFHRTQGGAVAQRTWKVINNINDDYMNMKHQVDEYLSQRQRGKAILLINRWNAGVKRRLRDINLSDLRGAGIRVKNNDGVEQLFTVSRQERKNWLSNKADERSPLQRKIEGN